MHEKPNKPRPAEEVLVCRPVNTRIVTAQDEIAAVYFWTDRLIFTVSTLPPGGRSSRDPGHKGADEVLYITKGTMVVEFDQIDRCELLNAGDGVLIPENEPHTIINPGDTVAECIFATAPQLGY